VLQSILPNLAVHRQTIGSPAAEHRNAPPLISFFLCTRAVHSAEENLMSAEAARRAPLMSLKELVAFYLSLAGEFGKPVALSAFPFALAESERLFSGYDEDYHISRFFHFTESSGTRYSINGFPATHVSLDAEVQTIL
jgi:hypothetical protein